MKNKINEILSIIVVVIFFLSIVLFFSGLILSFWNKTLDDARIVDLQKLKQSIDEEIDNKVKKIVGRRIKHFYIDEMIKPKE